MSAPAEALPYVEFPPWFGGYRRSPGGRYLIEGERYEYREREDFRRPARYKAAYGGRTGSKTRTIAQHLIMEALLGNMGRCIGAREYKESVKDSVKPALEWAIDHLGVKWAFRVQREYIYCRLNDAVFQFAGLERNQESKRGWEGVTHGWVDEAHRMSAAVAEILIPTLMRGETPVTLFFTWNDKNRADWVHQRFIENPRPGDIIAKVNWSDNPWFPPDADEERRAYRRLYPNRYLHVWEGYPDDGDAENRVLPYAYLEPCIEAHDLMRRGQLPAPDTGLSDGGLDIADGGENLNALVFRDGPVIARQEAWPSERAGYLKPTAMRAARAGNEAQLWRLYYDGSGVGSPIRGDFEDLPDAIAPDFPIEPILLGGSVMEPHRPFDRRTTNGQKFANRAAQLAWAVRLRALRTIQLLEGADIDINECLLIPRDLPGLTQFLAKLAQPMWRDNPTTGKIEIDKRAKEGMGEEKSPDEYDATIFAFARDSRDGLVDLTW